MEGLSLIDKITLAFNPDQERDAGGKWTSGGGEPKTGKVDSSEIKPKADLSGRDLSSMDLTDVDLSSADLSDADLTFASLYGAHLPHADLNNAKLSDANLTNAKLAYADLTNAEMTGADLNTANLFAAYLANANLGEADLTNATLTNAVLTQASLRDANLTDAIFTGANLRYADLTGAIIDGATFTGADTYGAIIPQVEPSNRENKERLEAAKESAQFSPDPTLGSFSTHELSFDELMQAINDENEFLTTPVQTYLKGAGRFTEGADPEALKISVAEQIGKSADFSATSGIDGDSLRAPRQYTDAWQNSSNDTWQAEMIQESASRVLLDQEADHPKGWDNNYKGTSAQAELVVFEMYQRTQKELADVGYKPDDTVTLFRGIKDTDGLSLRPLSSWSLQPSVAQNFSGDNGSVFVADVQVANIVSLPTTGFGCYDESEVIVLSKGADNLTAAFNPDQERDEDGKWTSSKSEPKTGKVDPSEIVPNADLRGRDLSGMDLSGMDLTGINFTGANLTGANLTGTILSGAYLIGANLRDANLTRAELRSTDLTHANLAGADLTEANLNNADLDRANLIGANLTNAVLQDANLTWADLSSTNLTSADLTGANLYLANLRDADLTNASLHRANLPNTDFTGANLEGTDLTRADLTDANLRDAINLSRADLTSARLIGAKLPASSRENANGDLLEKAIAQADFDPKDAEHFDAVRVKSSNEELRDSSLSGTSIQPLVDTEIKGNLGFGKLDVYAEELKIEVEKQIENSASFSKDGIGWDSLKSARDYTDSWASTSNDTRKAEMIQESASRVLLDQEAPLPTGWDNNYTGQSTQAELVVFEMYQRTQKELADAGYKPDDTIALYRGVRGSELALRPLSSWTTAPNVAAQFARDEGTVWAAEVPIANILATPITGFGCYDEGEVIVLDKPANNLTAAFNPDQERDEDGKWTSGGGEPKTGKVDPSEIKPSADLNNRDLSDMDLSGIDLRNAQLFEAVLRDANLTDAKMAQANLSYANLIRANLTDADLYEADLPHAKLAYADLTRVNAENASLTDVYLNGANLQDANLRNADLNSADLTGANLDGVILDGAILFHTNFSGVDLTNVDLTNVDLGNAYLEDAILLESVRTGANGDLLEKAIAQADFDPKDIENFDVQKFPSIISSDWKGEFSPNFESIAKINTNLGFGDPNVSPEELKIEVEKQIENSASFSKNNSPFDSILDARGYTDSWQMTANDGRNAEMIQESASRVLLGQEASLPADWSDRYKGQSTQAELVVFEMYQRTQAKLADAGYKPDDTLTLYRGVEDSEIALRPLSSWTTDPSVAVEFANVDGSIFTAKVPIANIVATPVTGFGCYNEYEVIVATPNSALTAAFNPDQERDENGRWTSSGETTDKEAEKIVNAVLQNEGYSVKPLTGEVPMSGYMVAVPNTSHVVSSEDFFNKQNTDKVADSLDDFMEKHEAAFDDGAWLGLWYSKETSEIVYDVVDQIENREEAVAQGVARDQISIYDVVNGVEIQTGGTGGLTASGQARSFHNSTGQEMVGNDLGRKTNMDSFGSRAFRGRSKQTLAFNPNQERDENERWTSGGGTDTETFLGRDGSEKIANIADPDMARYARTNADLIRENTPQSSYEGDTQLPSDEVFKRNDSGLQQIASRTWAATFQQCEDITIAADHLLGFATQDREWSDDVQFGDGSIDTNAPVYAQEMLDALTETVPNESYESALFNIAAENLDNYGLEKILVGENTDLPYAMRGINNNTGFMDSLDLAFQEKENVGWSLASFVPAGDFAARMRSEISEGMNDEQSAISIAKGFQSPMVSDTEPERVGLIHLTNGSALAVSTDSFEIVTGGEFKIVDRLTGPQATDYLENLAKTAADYGDDIGYSDQTVYVVEQVALPDYERGD